MQNEHVNAIWRIAILEEQMNTLVPKNAQITSQTSHGLRFKFLSLRNNGAKNFLLVLFHLIILRFFTDFAMLVLQWLKTNTLRLHGTLLITVFLTLFFVSSWCSVDIEFICYVSKIVCAWGSSLLEVRPTVLRERKIPPAVGRYGEAAARHVAGPPL